MTYTVDTLSDNGPSLGMNGGVANTKNPAAGDFRYCLNQALANPGSTVQFASGLSGTIDLTDPLPQINQNVTIDGPGTGAPQVGVDRAPTAAAFGIFTVNQGVTAAINGLDIGGGSTPFNGGGINNSGNLTLNDDVIENNNAGPTGGQGGGIFNNVNASLNFCNCDICGNTASQGGGGIYNEGQVVDCGSSISCANTAPNGGGYYQQGSTASTEFNMTQFSTNIASTSSGGGVYIQGGNFTQNGGGIMGNEAGTFGGGLTIAINGSTATVVLTNVSIVCDGDVELTEGAWVSLIVARGKVTYPSPSRMVVVRSRDFVSNPFADREVGTKETPDPFAFVKFFELSDVGLTVAERDGKGEPVRDRVCIKEVRKGLIFSPALQAGDVVTAVDGIKASSPEVLRKLLRKQLARGGPRITFTVRRAGQTTEIAVPVKD